MDVWSSYPVNTVSQDGNKFKIFEKQGVVAVIIIDIFANLPVLFIVKNMIKKEFQENGLTPVRINYQDAYMAIGRLGWRPMSDAEKAKNKIDLDIPYYKTKHELEIIHSELKDPEAYRLVNQLSPEKVLLALAKHAYYEMREADGYYEDSLYPRKLSKRESALYENIFKVGVVVLPIEEQKSVIYEARNSKHEALVTDGLDFVKACEVEIKDRKAWLKKNMELLQNSSGIQPPKPL